MKSYRIANHELYTVFDDGQIHSGIRDQWDYEVKRKRKLTTLKNLGVINARN